MKINLSYLKEIVSEKTKRIILAHLSEECNTEALALQEVIKEFSEPTFKLLCARQREPLDVITIGEEDV